MNIARTSTVGVILATALVGGTIAGCSKDSDEKSPSSSSSSSASSSAASESSSSAETSAAAAGTDYSNLLLKPSDIDPSFTATTPPVLNPGGSSGVGQAFTNPGKNETIYFTIVVLDSADKAGPELEGLKTRAASKVSGTPQPADVGTGGTLVTGTSPDSSKAITEVFFSEGKAVANIEFESAANDPVQPETALAIAKMQDEQIKKNLPS